jgi:ADP-ribosylglycohydrolase
VLLRHLSEYQTVHPDQFALELSQAYISDPHRSYGHSARALLTAVHSGQPWQDLSPASFAGMGSMGNGAAMRVAPLGAWFAGNLDFLVDAARLSARVTHANRNSIEGAVAIALTAAHFARKETYAHNIWDSLLMRMKASYTRERIFAASKLSPNTTPAEAAEELGTGRWGCAHETVPFAIWSVLRHPRSYEDALWTTIEGKGSTDITCAMVGGILGAGQYVPSREWLLQIEPLPTWLTGRPLDGTPVDPRRRTSA